MGAWIQAGNYLMKGVVRSVQILLFVNIQAILFFRFPVHFCSCCARIACLYLVNVLST
jgi:hypothetical protein